MIRQSLCIFLSLCVLGTCYAQNMVMISGRIDGIGTGKKIYLGNRGSGMGATFIDFRYDSTISVSDSFSFNPFFFTDIVPLSIDFENSLGWQTFTVDTGKVYIHANYKNFGAKQVAKGSINNDVSSKYYATIYSPWSDSINAMSAYHRNLMLEKDTVSAEKYMTSFYLRYKEATIAFFLENFKKSPYSAFEGLTMRRFVKTFSDSELQKYFLMLPENEQSNPKWISLKYKMDGSFSKNTSVNTQLPDFKFMDIEKKDKNLYDLKGSYKLLDFWASWCKPCLEMAPKVDSLLRSAPESKINLITINLDNNFQTFVQNESKYKTKGIKLYESGFNNSVVATYFAISQIPFLVLLDDQNRVIQTNISFKELEKFINQLN